MMIGHLVGQRVVYDFVSTGPTAGRRDYGFQVD